ncbi:MAG: ABC transporter permease subunit [Rhodocyclaceae bacterium]|nr:ABC transporter permease subunit [Rhodocyclaceae bacterium]
MNARRWLWAAALATYAFLYIPLAVVVLFSFNDSTLNAQWVGFTTHWYARLLADGEMLRAAANSLLLFFRQVLDLTLGFASILVAHITFSIGFVAPIVRARLAGMDESIFEAARDLGATPWASFRRVTLPLILPALLAGFLMSFTLSIDDFVITFFVAGVGVTTLPLQIYSMIKVAVTPEVNAVSTLLMALTLTLIFLASRVAPDVLKARR